MMHHRVGCGCGWFYETADKHLGALHCKRQYEAHADKCPWLQRELNPLKTLTAQRHQ